MHDINKMFEEYLPIWSEIHHQPIPTMKNPDKWYIAWMDFMNEVLIPKHSEIKQDYLNIILKADQINKDIDTKSLDLPQKPSLQDSVIPKKKSNWELVQEKRKKKL